MTISFTISLIFFTILSFTAYIYIVINALHILSLFPPTSPIHQRVAIVSPSVSYGRHRCLRRRRLGEGRPSQSPSRGRRHPQLSSAEPG